MTRHVFDHQTPNSKNKLAKFLKIKRELAPAPNTVALQRRTKSLDSARCLQEFLRVERQQDT